MHAQYRKAVCRPAWIVIIYGPSRDVLESEAITSAGTAGIPAGQHIVKVALRSYFSFIKILKKLQTNEQVVPHLINHMLQMT